jgi:hypothetical protein
MFVLRSGLYISASAKTIECTCPGCRTTASSHRLNCFQPEPSRRVGEADGRRALIPLSSYHLAGRCRLVVRRTDGLGFRRSALTKVDRENASPLYRWVVY